MKNAAKNPVLDANTVENSTAKNTSQHIWHTNVDTRASPKMLHACGRSAKARQTFDPTHPPIGLAWLTQVNRDVFVDHLLVMENFDRQNFSMPEKQFG